MFVYFRIASCHKGEFDSAAFSVFPVFFVGGVRLVFSSTVAHKGVFLGSLPMLFEHQHPLVVGVGRSIREEKSDTLTFRLGLLHLLLRQTLATPEPCRGKDRALCLKQKIPDNYTGIISRQTFQDHFKIIKSKKERIS